MVFLITFKNQVPVILSITVILEHEYHFFISPYYSFSRKLLNSEYFRINPSREEFNILINLPV